MRTIGSRRATRARARAKLNRPQLRAPETLELELELREGQRRVRTRALQALQPMQTAWVSQWRQLHGEMRVS